MYGITIENGEIHVKTLEKDTPDEAKAFSQLLYSMLPRIKLTDLLLEVANWTNFDEQFIHTSTGKKPKEEEKPIVMAALMAMGTNVGLVKMAEATPGITYFQMANTLAAALKEMGKIEMTIFILDYISNEALRRRIQKGLNKGEATNALARAIFFGKRGELHEKALKDQL